MSDNYNMGALGVIAPFKAKEGTITISDGATAFGDMKVPILSAQISKGDYIALDGEMIVKKAGENDVIIGIAYNTPKWTSTEPTTNYTQAQAVSGDMLREVGVETVFKKIITLGAKASENITAGKYLVLKSTGVELSASSGSTVTDLVALSAQDSNDKVVVGFI